MVDKKNSVLIVDDEFRIGLLIKKLIHWSELNMECLDVLDSGENAIKIIKEKNPDIVITDIRMPKVNGLDLIKTVRDHNMGVAFIVISGYKEFEYAHKALAYGVEDYILKPVNEKDLNDALCKIRKKLNDQEILTLHQTELQKNIDKSNRILRQDFLKNVIDQRDNLASSEALINMEGELYRGIDIKLDYIDYEYMDTRQDVQTVNKVYSLVESAVKTELKEFLICEKDYLHIYCLFNYNCEKEKDVKELISKILIQIKDYLMGFDQYEVTIGIGSAKSEFGEMRFSILESYRAVCNRMYNGTGRLIYAETFSEDMDIKLKKRFENIRDSLHNSIETFSVENIEINLRELFKAPESIENMDMSAYYITAEKVIELFFNYLNQEQLFNQKKLLLTRCQHCYKLEQLTNLLIKSLGSCLEMIRETEETKAIKPIRQAKEYVEKHYAEKILLEDIATIVDLNPVYFSALFKKETDTNFSDYLINIRMEHAKEMLIATNDTIAAIGDAVGYSDQKYFSQLFKKIVGVKPSIYRRLHS